MERGAYAISARALGLILLVLLTGQLYLSTVVFFVFEGLGAPASTLLYVTLLMVLIGGTTWGLHRRGGLHWRLIGGRPMSLWGWALVLPGAILCVGSGTLFALAMSQPNAENLGEFTATLSQALTWQELVFRSATFCFIVPVTEELVFRGALFSYLRERASVVPALLLSSGMFALWHIGALAAVSGLRDQTLLWVALTCLGLVFGIARWLTGSLLPAIVIRGLYNEWVLFLMTTLR